MLAVMALDRSITSTESFQARLLQAERWRLGLVAGCMSALLFVWIGRRAVGGVVASVDSVFAQVVSILGVGIVLTGAAYWVTLRRAKEGARLSRAWAIAGAVVDLGVPFGVLAVLQVGSPRGAYAALSGPSLMFVPIVVMLSVLRLRPLFSLGIGLVAACLHWALAARAIVVADLPREVWPPVFSYGMLLALTGVAAAVLAKFVRKYIAEAVSEAEAAERAGRALLEVEHELEVARTIQMSLLPKEAPRLAGFDIAGMARPATQAGGDYYDWQELPDGRVVVAIADVTGHGVGPALVMAVCRAYARATAPRSGSAKELLERMNGLIVGDIKGQRFITMAVALIGRAGDVELLSAGHGPTYVYRGTTGKVEEFGGNGLPLGIDSDEQFDPTAYLRLESGDSLVLLTDGFMEQAGPGGELFGTRRLAQVIGKNGPRPAAELLGAIDREVKGFAAGAGQGDDMTVVVVRKA
jgi:serine phosphatase RsbU (regulator of sigma subunit)